MLADNENAEKTRLAAEIYRRDGAVILEGIISGEIADSIKNEMQTADETKPYAGFIKGKTVCTSRENQAHHRFRFKDIYINFENARDAVLAPALIDLLYEIMGEPVMAFQSLGFTRGSGLRVHRDSNFLAIDKPETVIGTWLALEDIEAGSGELAYYPGSHRFPAYNFSDGSLHRIKTPGKASYNNDEYVHYLNENIAANHLEEKRFLARKGDCLVWHADIVHAGTPVTRPELSRYSLATHFCAISARPNYFNHFKKASIVKHTDKASFSSTHYNLSEIPESSLLKGRIIKPNIPPPATA
jgi:ectoine hydroxylase-related dioxygenase (phytanoyl-CoA dioxygenase family)